MLPEPLHPMLVHFPVALTALLLPAAVYGAIVSYRTPKRGFWSPAVALASLALVSALIAQQAGERDEDRVEPWVGKAAIEHHEERAEGFVWSLGAVFGFSILGFGSRGFGRTGRALTIAALIPAITLLVLVGESGGDLVYEHGAAAAYTDDASGQQQLPEESISSTTPPRPSTTTVATIGG